ncbi:MAG: hypothetical protein IIT36_04410, partial [Aeriscardovia sp.]|nr:hypothetical protein [Aeriscardovia sp.]
MQDNMDRLSGFFSINREIIAGDLIYNKESGVILLNLTVTDAFPIGRSYEIIIGTLHSGVIV